MASIELGETEGIAKQYSNGNISKFIRDLIMNYHHQQNKKQEIQETNKKQTLFQSIMFFIMGITFLTTAVSQIINITILTTTSIYLLIFSGLLLMYYTKINYKKMVNIKEVKPE